MSSCVQRLRRVVCVLGHTSFFLDLCCGLPGRLCLSNYYHRQRDFTKESVFCFILISSPCVLLSLDVCRPCAQELALIIENEISKVIKKTRRESVSTNDGITPVTSDNNCLTTLTTIGTNWSSNDPDLDLDPSSRDCLERIVELERELNAAQHSIAEKDAKCSRLSAIQDHIDSDVQELTEKLFQEAYKMVNEAESRRAKAEKLLAESRLKVDMLSAEVAALKIIVKSPSQQQQQHQPHKIGLASRLLNVHRKEKSQSMGPAQRKSSSLPAVTREMVIATTQQQIVDHKPETSFEVDPVYHREFTKWHENGAPLDDEGCAFLSRVMLEEVAPCMNFDNTQLSSQVLSAIRTNQLELEPVKEAKPTVRICALSNVPRFCPYRLRVHAASDWCFVSMLARNRIASVCDFFTYMRYVNQGIVKSGIHDSYWDVVYLRKNMALAKLGLGFIPNLNGGGAAKNRPENR
ncbi:unnamed protein product [Anisakis simplex]|uniref:Sec2p domain-containing protein n=1 Tax=Anisakis simplex TaxID=6269 RepID=A0A0M3IYN5_ANISI|nr:unnamed protein product [Anisakis simplex]